MLESLTGFVVIGLAILIGYVIARIDLLGPHGRPVLARLTFFVLSPFLLFAVLAQADVTTLFSAFLPVSAIAAAVMIVGYGLIARFAWKRPVGETVIGALSAGQVNSNNIGIPLSLYLLGSAAYPAPVILMQLVVLTPIALALLDAATSGTRSIGRILLRTATNPIVIGAVIGMLFSISGIDLPPVVIDPIQLVADACIPVLLISYGMSLYGQRVLGSRGRRRDVLLASALKLIVMPVAAWAVAEYVFHLSPQEVLVCVVLAALPTAQNVFNYSQRYGVGEAISRDTIFITTVLCVPVLLLATVLLHP